MKIQARPIRATKRAQSKAGGAARVPTTVASSVRVEGRCVPTVAVTMTPTPPPAHLRLPVDARPPVRWDPLKPRLDATSSEGTAALPAGESDGRAPPVEPQARQGVA